MIAECCQKMAIVIDACIANERKATNGSLGFQAFGFLKQNIFNASINNARATDAQAAGESILRPEEIYPTNEKANVARENGRFPVALTPGCMNAHYPGASPNRSGWYRHEYRTIA